MPADPQPASAREVIGREVERIYCDGCNIGGEGAADAILSAVAAAGYVVERGWRASSDELPADDTLVVVAGGVGFRRDGEWRTITGYPWPGAKIEWEVTHWRLLPTPPGAAP